MIDDEKRKTFYALNDMRQFKFRLAIEGVVVGVFVGCIIGFYRFCLEFIAHNRSALFEFFKVNNPVYLGGWVVVLLCVAWLIDRLVKFAPLSGSSGIPQIKGSIMGIYKTNWWKIIISKLSGCIMAIGAGLSLGREGPSIQLGGMAGQGVSRFFGRSRMEERCLISAGAGAGLAAAFNAPIASVMFTMEVLHRTLSPIVLLPTLVAALVSTMVSHAIFGRGMIFDIPKLILMTFDVLPHMVVLGVFIGLAGVLFNKAMVNGGKFYELSFFKNNFMRYLFPLLLTIPIGFLLPEIMGGGDAMIVTLISRNATIRFLVIVLVGKFIFTMLSAGSGIPGGTLQPMLVMGALGGYIYGAICIKMGILPVYYLDNCIVFGMVGFFAATVRCPLTGILLILELTGSFMQLFSLCLVTLFANTTAEFFHSEPIYDVMLRRSLVKDKKINPDVLVKPGTRNVMEIPIESGSMADGKLIKDIAWPENTLVVGVKRGGFDIVPGGNTRLMAGDYIYMVVNTKAMSDIRKIMVKE